MKCPICDGRASHLNPPHVECPRCGAFSCADLTFDRKSWIHLSGAVRAASDADTKLALSGSCEDLLRRTRRPRSAGETFDHLVLLVGKETTYIGRYTRPEPWAAWAARLFVEKDTDARNVAAWRPDLFQIEDREGHVNLALTPEGWRRYDALRGRGVHSTQAFIAMWYDPALEPAYEAIFAALTDTGYRPYRVDKDHFTDRIDDRMMSEIRASHLLVADLTGDRAGVYYEAGFAQALGIEVIWTCNASWRTRRLTTHPNAPPTVVDLPVPWPARIHFDVDHLQFLSWDDEEELGRKVSDRIRARGLALNTTPPATDAAPITPRP